MLLLVTPTLESLSTLQEKQRNFGLSPSKQKKVNVKKNDTPTKHLNDVCQALF